MEFHVVHVMLKELYLPVKGKTMVESGKNTKQMLTELYKNTFMKCDN